MPRGVYQCMPIFSEIIKGIFSGDNEKMYIGNITIIFYLFIDNIEVCIPRDDIFLRWIRRCKTEASGKTAK